MRSKNSFQDVILDSLSEGLITVDRNFQITFFNQAAEKITCLSRNDVYQKTCKSVCKSLFCETECPIALVLKTGKPIFDFDSRIQGPAGKIIPIKLNAAVLKDEQNEPVGGVISFRDMRECESDMRAKNQQQGFHGMIGNSWALNELFSIILEISESDASVFIQGETGTGKELVANAIQKTSKRFSAPFIKVNCSVLPPHLLASELFGHCRGAFTDAKKDRIGRFEIAQNGTIFLDEVAEIPLDMQTQLLRILQDGSFERLGETKTRYVDVRVIAATNIDINKAIQTGKFREDLFYRLNVIPIKVPPLRERMADLPLLIKHFINKNTHNYHKTITDIDDNAFDRLMQHTWPGNVRELENVIEFSYIRSKKNNSICLCGLPPYLRENLDCNDDEIATASIAQIKADKLLQILEQNDWNQTKTAAILGVNRTTIWRKLKVMGISQ